jgi:hypothetical protein
MKRVQTTHVLVALIDGTELTHEISLLPFPDSLFSLRLESLVCAEALLENKNV